MAAANGKTHFDALGQSYVLAYDINALCDIEERLGIEDVRELQEMLKNKLSIKKLRSIFCAGLTPKATEEQAGNIIQEMGFADVAAMIGEAFKGAFPADKGTGTGNPPKAAAGTG
jgi:GTP cyclohydrolase III